MGIPVNRAGLWFVALSGLGSGGVLAIAVLLVPKAELYFQQMLMILSGLMMVGLDVWYRATHH